MTATVSRIPASLQAVFMASNKGEEVYVPPTDNSASRVFQRNRNEQTRPVFVALTAASCFPASISKVPPQAKFHLKLKERGYFPRNYASKRSAYCNKPTEHQLASYGGAIIDVVRQNRVEEFRRMLEAGLSPNACNEHGESLLHMICRHGKVELFRILVAYDVDMQQTDDYGRTAMHDCCWASQPSFEIAKCLMQRDSALLFLFDARGSLPLNYVARRLYGEWNFFMEQVIDEIFPRNKPDKDDTPVFCTLKPDTRPVPDPKEKIPSSLANMVATGMMKPYEVLIAMAAYEDETVQCSEYGSDESSSSFSDSDLDSDDELGSDEEEELFRITGEIGMLKLGDIEEH